MIYSVLMTTAAGSVQKSAAGQLQSGHLELLWATLQNRNERPTPRQRRAFLIRCSGILRKCPRFYSSYGIF